MDDTISSGDSDVEIIGVYDRHLTKADPPPLSDVKVYVADDAVNHYVDLTDPGWCFPNLKLRKRHESNYTPIIDLTECDEKDQLENILPDCQIIQDTTGLDISSNEDLHPAETSAGVSTAPPGEQGCVPTSQKENRQQNSEGHPRHQEPVVKLTRLPVLELHAVEATTSRCSVEFTKVCVQMSERLRRFNDSGKTQSSLSDLNLAALSKVEKMDPSVSPGSPLIVSELEQQGDMGEVAGTRLQTRESQHSQSFSEAGCSRTNGVTSADNKTSEWSSSVMISSSTVLTPQGEQRSEHQSQSSGHSPPHSPVRPYASERFNSDSVTGFTDMRSDVDLPPTWETQESEMDLEGQSETEMYHEVFDNDSPLSIPWQEWSDGEDTSEERSVGRDFRAVKGDDLHYVSPAALMKLMARPSHDPFDEDGVGAPELLSRQRLSQVYTTIEVNYPEGTLQQLFDLLQPGYYLPADVVGHLLRGILLNRQCSRHHRAQAFNLLMRTQRYHIADKTTVSWDWELLTSVMESQDGTETQHSETVRMFLEYIIQTLEDDFHANNCPSDLPRSIGKATLSCNQQFSRVRDVIKWLFSVITKSTRREDSNTTTRERDDYIRMVTVFQRMLSLALEVDGSPALSSAKLSLELFHTLLSVVPLRAHRMLLLDTLRSKQLKCKLLEHLLDYACPVKIQDVPMSLSLLLHFLKNSTLAPDPSDGTERWKKWEELIQLFWMLLISYNKAMKGYLRCSKMDQRSKVNTVIYKAHDVISAGAVREAVEAFLSRSKADLGHKLPLHVEESLTYLQDHLLDACRCEHQQIWVV